MRRPLSYPGIREGRFTIDAKGNIRLVRKWGRKEAGSLCSTPLMNKGYPVLKHYDLERHCSWETAVHRLVMHTFIGPCPPGMQVNHKDGDKTNNCVSNLEYVTPRDNNLHAIHVLGRKTRLGCTSSYRGSRHHASKVTALQRLAIRLAHSKGETQKSIGKRYGITQSAVSYIVTYIPQDTP